VSPAEQQVYLDNHATTRVDPRVVEAMLPFFTQQYGNAASTSHSFGHEAKAAVDEARESIAAAIGATAREIVFTSGATESNNLAIVGAAQRQRRAAGHLVSVATEHKAVLDPLERLSRRGFEVSLLNVEQALSPMAGLVHPEQVAEALRPETLLVSVMLANNEIGVIQPVAQIAALCRERGVLVHCDATQAVGKLPVDVAQLGVDLLSFSAHKLYGPKGVGALYVRRSRPAVRLECQIAGGGHEGGLRSGTLNVPGIVGFAKALELCLAEMHREAARLAALRNRLWEGLRERLGGISFDALPSPQPSPSGRRSHERIEGVSLNGPALDRPELRLPNNLNVSIALVDGEALMMNIRDLAVSSGAACTSANPEPSHVLRALGMSDDAVRSSLRFGLGRFTTADEIEFAINSLERTVGELRKLSSLA
jgi:cysteine desulfurase